MAHFGEASKRLVFWINENPHITRAFYAEVCPPDCRTIEQYLGKYAYLVDIIPATVERLMKIETARVIEEIMRL